MWPKCAKNKGDQMVELQRCGKNSMGRGNGMKE